MTTEVHDLYLDGDIDERGREAVDFANTHSESMAANHYLMRDAERQAQDALRVASVVAPRAAAVQASTPQRILDGSLRSTPRPSSTQQWRELQWGTAHPLFQADTIRAQWSEAEVSTCITIFLLRIKINYSVQLNYIRAAIEWIRVHDFQGVIPPSAPVVPRIMNRIRGDPEAVPIFLFRHIETPDRLSTGVCMPHLI
jgi:hypothetical protein